ncbi:hypothetical protein CNR22_22290 [Sphingobacteriaceae bacterium]|nr:hypothetical protein CNR22_22290 [Sphingobacteriaceae bacterium]
MICLINPFYFTLYNFNILKSFLSKLNVVLCCILIYTSSSVSAQTGSSLNFDGYNTNVTLPDYASSWDLGDDFTVEAWINPSTVSGTRLILYSGFGCLACPSWVMSLGPESTCGGGGTSGHLVFNAAGFVVESDNVISTTGWTHVAATYNGSVMRLYINGALQTSSVVATFTVTNSQYRVIGGDPSYWFGCSPRYMYQGDLDEIRTWNRALCASEIVNTMSCEIPTNSTGLTSNYHFNQGVAAGSNTVTTLTDATSNAIHGSLNGFYLNGTTGNWVGTSPFLSGTSCTMTSLPDIKIYGNGNYIPLNFATPATSNNTQFGNVALGSTLSHSFVIKNNASGTLSITAAAISGSGASHFSITTPTALTVAGTSSTSIVVSFSPSTVGTKSATLTLTSNDCDESPYVIALEGTGTTPASALDFDGTDDFVGAPNSSTLMLTTALSLEAWVKPTNISGVQYVVSKGTNDMLNGQYGLVLINGIPQFHMYNGNAHIGVTYNYTVASGVWTHLAATWNGTMMNVYVNGTLNLSGPYQGTLSANTESLQIGRLTALGYYYSGSLDEIRIWNLARSACDIQAYMNCEIPGAATGLIANYHFNQGSAGINNSLVTSLNDASAYNITGTLNNFNLTGTNSNWISPGAVTNGYTVAVPSTASISVTGNSNPIVNNSTTVTPLNFTDFGSAGSHTFVIQNSNTGTLNIGVPYLTGANAAEFSITGLPSSTLAASASSSFVVAFTPTAGGTRTATVRIDNNDCNIPIFNFEIHGAAPLASALNFDGIDDYISVPLNANIPVGNSPYTIEAKIKPNFFAAEGIIGWGNYGTTNQVNALRLGPSGAVYNYWYANDLMITAPTLTNGSWHHLAATFDGTVRSIYVDGILYGQDFPAGHAVPNNANMQIGYTCGFCGGEPFNGNIDEVRVWNIARSQCEIQTYQDCEIPAGASGLVLNYHLNQGAAGLNNTAITTVTDASSNGLNGTLTNMSLNSANSNWVVPGSVANSYSITNAPTASISVSGNGNTISSNATSASTLNHTDFGTVTTRTFVIQNSNTGTLNVGAPFLTGLNAGQFSITVLPSPTLSAGATTSFVIAFTPTAGGVQSAVVNIKNNDCTIPTFNFVINGHAPPGEALSFDGADDYINLPSTNLPTGNSDFTVEFWVKINSTQTSHRWITYMGTPTAGSMVTIGYDGSNGNKIRIHHLGPDLMASTASITPNVWTHVAVNYRGSSYTNDLFINGSYIETLSFGTPLTLPAGGAFQIGTFDSYSQYCPNVDLDEFRIWNRALCENEIQNNISCEISSTAPGLISAYHFNQGNVNVDNTAVTTLTDATSSANTGTLVNFASTSTVSNWVAPGAVTTGSSCTVFLNSEIGITGNGSSILNGSSTPTLSNFTDFGALCSNTAIVKTFSIQNSGTGALTISSVSMSGTDASLFAVGALSAASPIAAGSGASFNVTLTPGSSGIKTATLNITNNDCDESAFTFVISGTALALPTVTASTSHSIICNTASTSVYGLGADTYTWTGNIPVINNIPFNPTITATYTVAGSSTLTGCTSTNLAVQIITVNALPTVTATTSNSLICNSGTTSLIGTGADTYTWNPLISNATSFAPSSTATYTLSGTYTLTGCTNTNLSVQTISVNPSPTISLSVINPTLCAGNVPTLTAANAVTYTWIPGNFTTAIISPTLNATTIFTLNGSSAAGCLSSNTLTQSITVYALPVVTASASNLVVCSGNTTSVFGGGAQSYVWTGGISNNTSFSPSATSVYTVTGTDANGCQNTAILTLTVNPTPNVSTNISSTVVCAGTSITLSGTGAATYNWSGGITDAQAFAPAVTMVYTLTGTSAAGCTSTASAQTSVTVNALPTVTASATNPVICYGQTSTLNGSGASTYTWSNGVTNAISFSPTLTNVYSLTGEDANGCKNTATATITVNNLPIVNIVSSSTLLCEAAEATLSVNGASTYTWSTKVTSSELVITPTVSTTYSVTGTDVNGCINSTAFTQSVSPCLGTLTAISAFTNVSCGDKTDGKITINANQTYSNSTLSYHWSANIPCASMTCSTLENLPVGNYSVIVKATYTLNNILVKQDSIVIPSITIASDNGPCSLKIFNGISANGDGINDTWAIENISEFPKNKVMVFNRWGIKVYEVEGYNNLDKAWPTGKDLQTNGSNTYFYIIDLGNGSALIKGWIDLNVN